MSGRQLNLGPRVDAPPGTRSKAALQVLYPSGCEQNARPNKVAPIVAGHLDLRSGVQAPSRDGHLTIVSIRGVAEAAPRSPDAPFGAYAGLLFTVQEKMLLLAVLMKHLSTPESCGWGRRCRFAAVARLASSTKAESRPSSTLSRGSPCAWPSAMTRWHASW